MFTRKAYWHAFYGLFMFEICIFLGVENRWISAPLFDPIVNIMSAIVPSVTLVPIFTAFPDAARVYLSLAWMFFPLKLILLLIAPAPIRNPFQKLNSEQQVNVTYDSNWEAVKAWTHESIMSPVIPFTRGQASS